jgi:GntR family transcriptional regulator
MNVIYTGEGDRKLNIIISNLSQEPIYEQIVNQIKQLVMKGELIENDSLPSIRSLAKELQISVITTKRAYDELEKDGFIVTVPGKGTYIAAQNMELLRETRLKIIEEKLSEAVETAKSIKLTASELKEMLEILYDEE